MPEFELSVPFFLKQGWAVYAIVSVVGLMIGSFVNVIVFRLPKCMPVKAADGGWPLFGGRSKCPACGYTIRWYENIPVFSFILLKGRCSNCRGSISLRYPIIEILVGVLAALIILYFGTTWEAMARFAFCCLLLILTLIDFDTYLLPDALTLPAIWIGLFMNAFDFLIPAREAILGAVCGWVGFAAINTVYRLVSNRDGIGRGDWKLAAAIGAWLGYSNLLGAAFIAFLSGAFVGIALLVGYRSSRKKALPFGPFLAFGAITVIFFGPELMSWYLNWLLKGV